MYILTLAHFRSITETLQRRFRGFHPNDDALDSVIPHVTFSEHGRLADRGVLGRHARTHARTCHYPHALHTCG